MAEQIGAYHLADHPELYEVARSNNFEFVVSGIDELLKAGVDASDAQEGDIIRNGQDVIRLSVNKAFVPHFTQEVLTVNRGNTKIKYAGVPTFADGSIECNDYIGADTKSVLMAWQRLSCDIKSETVGRAVNYKKNCDLIEYTPDYQIIRTWHLLGCWISGISEGEFTMDSGDKRMMSCTIQYDRAIPELPEVQAE